MDTDKEKVLGSEKQGVGSPRDGEANPGEAVCWDKMEEDDRAWHRAVNVFRQRHVITTGGFLAKIRKLKLYGVPVNRFFEKNKSKK